jgi:hypothetical protein
MPQDVLGFPVVPVSEMRNVVSNDRERLFEVPSFIL